MDNKTEIDNGIFKQDAKIIVDMLFDTKAFREDITRDSMDGLQDLILYLLQNRHDSHLRLTALTEKINKSKMITT